MSASRFRPIQPHMPSTKASVVRESEKDVLKDVSTRRLSNACKECQRRRTKVRNLEQIASLGCFIFDVSNNSAVLEIRAWNARNVTLFAYLMGAPTSDARATHVKWKMNWGTIRVFWATFLRQYGILMMMTSITSSILCGRDHQPVKYSSRWITSLLGIILLELCKATLQSCLPMGGAWAGLFNDLKLFASFDTVAVVLNYCRTRQYALGTMSNLLL